MEESRAYDPAGRLASVTNAVGTTTDYTYYDNNQLATNYVPDPERHQENVSSYAYDAAGNPTTQTDPGGLVTGRLQRRRPAGHADRDRPAWTASPPAATTPPGT